MFLCHGGKCRGRFKLGKEEFHDVIKISSFCFSFDFVIIYFYHSKVDWKSY